MRQLKLCFCTFDHTNNVNKDEFTLNEWLVVKNKTETETTSEEVENVNSHSQIAAIKLDSQRTKSLF